MRCGTEPPKASPFSPSTLAAGGWFSQLDFKGVVNFYVFAIFCMSLCTIKRAALHRKKIGALYPRKKMATKKVHLVRTGRNGIEQKRVIGDCCMNVKGREEI